MTTSGYVQKFLCSEKKNDATKNESLKNNKESLQQLASNARQFYHQHKKQEVKEEKESDKQDDEDSEEERKASFKKVHKQIERVLEEQRKSGHKKAA